MPANGRWDLTWAFKGLSEDQYTFLFISRSIILNAKRFRQKL